MTDIARTTYSIGREIEAGRTRAHAKHGAESIEGIAGKDPRWLSILVEEVGEASHELTYDATGDLRAELVDIATVAVAWIAALDRGEKCAECGSARNATAHDDPREGQDFDFRGSPAFWATWEIEHPTGHPFRSL